MNRRISTHQLLRECCEEEEEYAAEAGQSAAVLPSAGVLDKIMRYETKLERQMHRAMAQLERVQRMRRGENIPVPLSVEVSRRERRDKVNFAKRTHFILYRISKTLRFDLTVTRRFLLKTGSGKRRSFPFILDPIRGLCSLAPCHSRMNKRRHV